MQQKYQLEILVDVKDWDIKQIETVFGAFDFKVTKIKKIPNRRSMSQNAALFKWLDMIADDCREKGLTLDALFKEPATVPITKEYLHNFAKKTTEVITGDDDKTSKLNTKQFSLLIETLIKVFGERLDNKIPFPNIVDKLHVR